MCNKLPILLSLIFIFSYFDITYSQAFISMPGAYYAYFDDCLAFRGFEERGSNGILHFKNQCRNSITANVCVEYMDGSYELVGKERNLARNREWRIPLIEENPRIIYLASAPRDPPIPGPCGEPFWR